MSQHRKSIEIINKLGLHARAAASFVNLANQFDCTIRVSRESRTVNGKSIMGLMLLAAARGTTVIVESDGDDAEAALEALQDLIDNRFGEGE